MIESQLAEAREVVVIKGKRKEVRVVKVDLVNNKNEIRVLRMKLDEEWEKIIHSNKKLEA